MNGSGKVPATVYMRLVIVKLGDHQMVSKKWCSGRDLNPHAFRHTPLKRTCLPFHHPSASANFNQERRKARSQGNGKNLEARKSKGIYHLSPVIGIRIQIFLASWFPDSF